MSGDSASGRWGGIAHTDRGDRVCGPVAPNEQESRRTAERPGNGSTVDALARNATTERRRLSSLQQSGNPGSTSVTFGDNVPESIGDHEGAL
jgi:hypothetical protein